MREYSEEEYVGESLEVYSCAEEQTGYSTTLTLDHAHRVLLHAARLSGWGHRLAGDAILGFCRSRVILCFERNNARACQANVTPRCMLTTHCC